MIEKGDLIKLDYSSYPYSENSFTIRFVDDMTFKGIHYNEDVIIAIYKSNPKDNYIKVWGKENDTNEHIKKTKLPKEHYGYKVECYFEEVSHEEIFKKEMEK